MTPTLLDGDEGAQTLRDACTRVRRAVSYLRADVVVGESRWSLDTTAHDTEWIRCDELLNEPKRLEELILSSGSQQGTDDRVVAASLFVQNYSYRVLSMAIACLTSSGVVPDSGANVMSVTMSRGRPSAVAYRESKVLAVSDATSCERDLGEPVLVADALNYVVARALDDHLTLLVGATRQRFRVGERLLWGNIASSLAVSFRTMEGCLGPWVRGLAEQFFRDGPEKLQGLGSFFALDHAGRRGWYWERTNCCLYDRLPGHIRCGDCSRTPVDERRAAYRASLEESEAREN